MTPPMTPALRRYDCGADALFQSFNPNIGLHRETMQALIERYGIRNRRILGVGPGDCAQEYWFQEEANTLFLIDIDENGGLEPRLKTLAAQPIGDEKPVTYIIGDARHVSDWLGARFDVIFTAGFTPDEAHRAQQGAAIGKVISQDPILSSIGFWPHDARPLSPLCAEIIERGLADDGLFVLLSYASGPDVIRARNYLPMLDEQLRGLGLSLLEVHCLASSPGCHLVVAMKSGDQTRTAERIAQLRALPPLKAIHGRSKYSKAAVRVAPGPMQLHPSNAATFVAGLLGESAEVVSAHVAPLLDRYAPNARTAYYAGEHAGTEGFYLLSRGVALELGWAIDVQPPLLAVERNLVHRNAVEAEPPTTVGTGCDLFFLSSLANDEAVRRTAAAEAANEALPLFDAGTLPFVASGLSAEGVLIYEGRSGGVDVNYSTTYAERIRVALDAAGLALRELLVMKALPGIFVFCAVKRGAAAEHVALPESISAVRFAHAVPDRECIRVWPRPPPAEPATPTT